MVTVKRQIEGNYVYYGLKQGQITPNTENKYVLKLSFGSPAFKYSVISKTYITLFFRYLLLSTCNVRMSEGTFCRVEVHILFFLPTIQTCLNISFKH